MKRAFIIAAVLVSAGVLSPTQATHAWSNYHWARTANPFTVTLVDSVGGGWDPLLVEAAQDWSASSVLDIAIESGSTSLLTQLLCQPLSGKARTCNFNYGPNLWFGQTTVWISSGHIVQSTVQVNDFYFSGTYANDVARLHVICHEVGHALGLDHHQQASCMDDTNSTLNNPSYATPNGHDIAQLATIYGHVDPISTTAQTQADHSSSRAWWDGELLAVTTTFWVA